MEKEQLRSLNCKKDKLGHKHLIHINKFGQMIQMPLKTHLPHPHKTHHSNASQNYIKSSTYNKWDTDVTFSQNCLQSYDKSETNIHKGSHV